MLTTDVYRTTVVDNYQIKLMYNYALTHKLERSKKAKSQGLSVLFYLSRKTLIW